MIKRILFVFCLLLMAYCQLSAWGFFAHQRINRLAIFTLPPEMMPFYKKHLQYLMENSVRPDMRRYAVKDEAPRHYIDADIYGDSALYKMPIFWKNSLTSLVLNILLLRSQLLESDRELTPVWLNISFNFLFCL